MRVRALHEDFLWRGDGEVELPYALARKYPNAGREWCWQYVFPARNVSPDPAHLLEAGADIPTVQELFRHKDGKTTMIYTHVMKKPGIGVRSPLDRE